MTEKSPACKQCAAPPCAGDERARFMRAIDAAYPIPDTPHQSVADRAMANREAFDKGWQAARRALDHGVSSATAASEPSGIPGELASAQPTDPELLQALQGAARLLRAAGFAMNGTCSSKIVEAINKHAGAQPVAAAPADVVQVPRAITEDMHTAAVRVINRATGNADWPPMVWAAMLAAAPAAPVAGDSHE